MIICYKQKLKNNKDAPIELHSIVLNAKNVILDIENDNIEVDKVNVLFDGKPRVDFGEAFSGYRFTAKDVFSDAVISYLNNDTSYLWEEIPKELQKLKAKYFKSCLNVHGREVPKYIYDRYMNRMTLVLASSGEKDDSSTAYSGCLAYLGDDGNFSLMDTATGKCITDMECFFVSGVCDMLKNDNIIYQNDDFVKQMTEEYLEA